MNAPGNWQPTSSGEEWLGRNRSDRRRLWERLSPPHRRLLRVLAQALVLRQEKARLPDALRGRLLTALDEIERLAARIESAARDNSAPPRGPARSSNHSRDQKADSSLRWE
jgi:hypothetical protein